MDMGVQAQLPSKRRPKGLMLCKHATYSMVERNQKEYKLQRCNFQPISTYIEVRDSFNFQPLSTYIEVRDSFLKEC